MAQSTQRRTDLSRERIIETAVALLDQHGLSALSMRRLAEELGVGTMTLYGYVTDKADLADGIVRRVLADLPMPDPADSWSSAARDLCWSLRQQALAHPAAFELVLLNERPDGSARLRAATVAALERAGLTAEAARSVRRAVGRFVMGWCIAELSVRSGTRSAARRAQEDADFAFALDALLDGLERHIHAR